MAMLREVGYDKPVYLHGTLEANSRYYASCPLLIAGFAAPVASAAGVIVTGSSGSDVDGRGESQQGFRLAKHITQRSAHGLAGNFEQALIGHIHVKDNEHRAT